jgi:hypothetical protein
MGCDIHAMVESRYHYSHGSSFWISCGRLKIDRNYDLFSVLANIRNYNNLPFISNPRLDSNEVNEAEDWYEICSEDFQALSQKWDCDGHSHSYVTLDELRIVDQELADKMFDVVNAHGYKPEESRLIFFFDN